MNPKVRCGRTDPYKIIDKFIVYLCIENKGADQVRGSHLQKAGFLVTRLYFYSSVLSNGVGEVGFTSNRRLSKR